MITIKLLLRLLTVFTYSIIKIQCVFDSYNTFGTVTLQMLNVLSGLWLHSQNLVSVPSHPRTKLNFETEFWGKEVEKSSFIALTGKRGHNRMMPSKLCPKPGGGSQAFYSNGSRRA